MSSDKKYYLCHSQTKTQSNPLSLEELKKMLAGTNLKEWYFWTEGLTNWEIGDRSEALKAALALPLQSPKPVVMPPPLPQFDEFEILATPTKAATTVVRETQVLDMLQPQASPLVAEPPVEAAVTVESPAPVAPAVVSQPAAMDNRRKHPRVPLKLRAVITNKVKAFITFTENVSLGGILVTHNIPTEILSGDCEVFLFNPKNQSGVNFKCTPLPDDSQQNRFSFQISESDQHKTLAAWIDLQELEAKKSS